MPDHEREARKAAVYRYQLRVAVAAWLHLHPGDEFQPSGGSADAKFHSFIVYLTKRGLSEEDHRLLAQYLDVAVQPTVEQTVTEVAKAVEDKSVIRDIDDITPNQFRRAVFDTARDLARSGELVHQPMPDFLRQCLKRVFQHLNLEGRINIGLNRNFLRMIEWLQQFAEDTDWDGAKGLKISNAGGRGRVAANPSDPKTLKVVLDADYLPV